MASPPLWHSGGVVHLRHPATGTHWRVLIEVDKPAPRLAVRLAPVHEPYTRLQVPQGRGKGNGKGHNEGGEGARVTTVEAVWAPHAGRFSVFGVVDGDDGGGDGRDGGGGDAGAATASSDAAWPPGAAGAPSGTAGDGRKLRLRSLAHASARNRTGGTGWFVGIEAARSSGGGGNGRGGRGCGAGAALQWVGNAGGDEAASLFVALDDTAVHHSTSGSASSAATAPTAAPGVPVAPSPSPPAAAAAGTPVPMAAGGGAAAAAPQARAPRLTASDKVALHDNGYVVVPGGAAPSLVRRALAVVNAALGRPGAVVAGGVEGAGKLAGTTAQSAALLDLVMRGADGIPPAFSLAEAVVGRGKLAPPRGCQLALRFPEGTDETGGATPADVAAGSGAGLTAGAGAGAAAADARSIAAASASGLLPGTEWHTDGMRQGRCNPFSLLLGVALSHVPAPLCGNFTVWPGSHFLLQQLMLPGGRLRGVSADDGRDYSVAVGGGDHSNPWCAGSGLPDLGTPTQLLLQPGDVVLAHPKLAHRGGPNLSPHIRYMVYFRLKHVDHGGEAMQTALLGDAWADLEGMWAVAEARRRERASRDGSGADNGGSCDCDDGGGGGDMAALQARLAAVEAENRALRAASARREAPFRTTPTPTGSTTTMTATPSASPLRVGRVLTAAQVASFVRDGVVVVPGIIDADGVRAAFAGLCATLSGYGVNNDELARTAHALAALSSTGGAGGVLDLFYPQWKLQVTLQNRVYASAMADLYDATFGRVHAHAADAALWTHPYGAFDARDVLAHVDRVGYRVPDAVALGDGGVAGGDAGGAGTRVNGAVDGGGPGSVTSHSSGTGTAGAKPNSRARHARLQRSLTPHLDCCPTAMYAGGGKAYPRWRPIQCMLSLTDNPEANTGGFECVRGFHREFEGYFEDMQRRAAARDGGDSHSAGSGVGGGAPRPRPVVCVGDYTAIRSAEDAAVVARFAHVPVAAGAAVFWDQRLPHANARRNDASTARAVVYGGYLPRVPLNVAYAREQLRRMRLRLPQVDFWIEEPQGSAGGSDGGGGDSGGGGGASDEDWAGDPSAHLGDFGLHLLGADLGPDGAPATPAHGDGDVGEGVKTAAVDAKV